MFLDFEFLVLHGERSFAKTFHFYPLPLPLPMGGVRHDCDHLFSYNVSYGENGLSDYRWRCFINSKYIIIFWSTGYPL